MKKRHKLVKILMFVMWYDKPTSKCFVYLDL